MAHPGTTLSQKLGVVRLLDSVGVRIVTPWDRNREALVERAPRSFEFAMGEPDKHHALHATFSGPGGFAVLFLFRTSPLSAPDGRRASF